MNHPRAFVVRWVFSLAFFVMTVANADITRTLTFTTVGEEPRVEVAEVNYSYPGGMPGIQPFTDIFHFSVEGDTFAALSIISLMQLDSVGLYTSSGGVVAFSTIPFSTIPDKADYFRVGSGLSTGDFYFVVKGRTLADNTGSYSGTVLMYAIPEPSTAVMLIAGLGVLGFCVWCRRRRALALP